MLGQLRQLGYSAADVAIEQVWLEQEQVLRTNQACKPKVFMGFTRANGSPE
jgi:hypothetical protein